MKLFYNKSEGAIKEEDRGHRMATHLLRVVGMKVTLRNPSL